MGGRIYKIYLHNKNALDEVVIKKKMINSALTNLGHLVYI